MTEAGNLGIRDAAGDAITRVVCVADKDGDPCAYSAMFDSDAAFIVRAVNAHDDLVAALKAARKAIHHAQASATIPSFYNECLVNIDAALKPTEGR